MKTNKDTLKELTRIKKLVSDNNITKNQFTRDIICREKSWITEHKIRKLFKNFKIFKDLVFSSEKTCDAQVSCYEDRGKYLFNRSTKDYIFDFTDVKNIGKSYVFNQTEINAIIQDYSNYDKCPKTLTEVSRIHKIPPWVLKKILNALNIVHDSLPLTSEYIEESSKSEDEISSDLLSQRTFNIYQKYTQQSWNQIQSNSDKWIQFERGIISPLKDILSTFQGPSKEDLLSVCKYDNSDNISTDDIVYIATLSDLHFGDFARKEDTFYSKKNWDIEDTKKALNVYVEKIHKDLNNRKCIPNECVVLSCGDILDSLSGFTDKNTKLNTNPIGISQFKYAFESLILFFTSLIKLFPKITVRSVPGNHDSLGDILLFEALKIYFKDYSNINFNITTCRWDVFILGNSLFVMEHGYSAKFKSKVPEDTKSKEVYVQKLIIDSLSKMSSCDSIKNRYFIMGDRHSYSQKMMSSFEFIQLPSIVESNVYADNLNLHNRPRQQCFILDKTDGIIETISCYTD